MLRGMRRLLPQKGINKYTLNVQLRSLATNTWARVIQARDLYRSNKREFAPNREYRELRLRLDHKS